MAVQPTYPGVYLQEIPSGVRTITGVATSITAFIGRALKGPLDEPLLINSFGDYNRIFGGLWVESTMSYAVQDFFQNGGGQAIIVRIAKGAEAAKVPLEVGGNTINLEAKTHGKWGNYLSASIEPAKDPISGDVNEGFYNLKIFQVVDEEDTEVETHYNLSFDEAETRFIDRILEKDSLLVKGTSEQNPANSDGSPPPSSNDGGSGGGDNPSPESRGEGEDAGLENGNSNGGSNNNPSPPVVKSPLTGGDDGDVLTVGEYTGDKNNKTGIYALLKTDIFNLLCIPPPSRVGDTQPAVYSEALKLCIDRRAMLIVDPPSDWGKPLPSPDSIFFGTGSKLSALGLSGKETRNAALFFPRVKKPDLLRGGQIDTFVPCGIIAGIMAKTDAERGVWKAPAGVDAALSGVSGLQININDKENGMLNQLGINCLRSFPVTGRVVWGARTLRGADQFADEYKYIPVRRLAFFIQESLYRGTQWAVFEPNDEPLWAQLRLNIGAFMHNLFRKGAFQGSTPKDAYLVKCDSETTTQNDINLGIVNILVGFAPLKPAEFVIIQIQQLAGQIEA